MKRTLPMLGLVFAASLALTSCGLGGTTSSETSSTAQVPELTADQQVSIVFESYNYGLVSA